MSESSLQKNRDGFSVRLRCGGGKQLRVTICTHDRRLAEVRLLRLQRMARALTSKGLTAEAAFLIRKAAAQTSEPAFELCLETAATLEPPTPSNGKLARTFRDLGQLWTSGELHRLYPDHVPAKASSDDDESRLGWLYQTIGDVPLAQFGLAEALLAMRSLPATAKRPATRRQYAQAIAKLLKYATFPCQLINEYPLPPGFLPKLTKGDVVFPYLYPAEDLQLLRSAPDDVGFCRDADEHFLFRLLFGTLNREGMRVDEALGMRWRNLDRDNGVIAIGTRKNGRAGTWPAAEGTLDALWALRDCTKDGPFEKLPQDEKYAARLRKMLLMAGVDRHALHNNEPGRRRLRAHDLRATFVTLALASGRSENWVSTRTGHMSSGQVNGYKRQAETAVELGHTEFLVPLDLALGLRVLNDGPTPSSSSCVGEGARGETEGESESQPPGGEPRGLGQRIHQLLPTGSEGRGRTGTPSRAADFEGAFEAPEQLISSGSVTLGGTGRAAVTGLEGAVETASRGSQQNAGTLPAVPALVEQLRAAAHAAVSAGNWSIVAELGKLIDKATAGIHRAPAEGSPAPSSAGPSALDASVPPAAPVLELSSRRRKEGQ
jgi:integrase